MLMSKPILRLFYRDCPDDEIEELSQWASRNGYIVSWRFGGSLLTILKKKTWDETCTDESFWGVRAEVDNDGLYLRILSAEVTILRHPVRRKT